MKKIFDRGSWQELRAFSPVVATEGSKTVWAVGHTGQVDSAGKSLASDIGALAYQTFRNIEATPVCTGASLKDAVGMTVLADPRNTTRMIKIHREPFATSAAITITGLADPRMLIEIQGVAR